LGESNRPPSTVTEDALCVLQAYGSSTYEVEETLFHKYMMICTSKKREHPPYSERDKFHQLLDKLSEMGYLKLISRGDKLYWMRLRSALELEEGGEELTPEKAQQMIDEARARRTGEQEEQARREREEPSESQKPSVGEIADVILSELEKTYEPEKLKAYISKDASGDIRRPIKEMHEALLSGVDEFRLYIERNVSPKLKGQLTYFLATCGRDSLLAALAISLMIPLRTSASESAKAEAKPAQ
jgi:hypothetical protein